MAGFALAAPQQAAAITLPSQFVVDDAAPGAGFDTPVGIAFFPSGRMLVAEKRGVVYSVFNGVKASNPMIDLQNEVLDNVDRGFLGIAIDPNYAVNRFVYFLYTVDPDTNGVDSNDDAFGRLVRYTVSPTDSTVVLASSRTILMGRNWREGPLIASPSHTIGSLRFGRDGSLLVTCGDGAQYTNMDKGGQDPNAFGATKTDPQEDIGAFRAQYLNSLCGKLLRLNPANGHGYPSNPFYNGDETSIRSRIWAYGLRNPFRFTVRPGTGSTNPANGNPGTIYLGNVGWATWEEMEIATQGGRNFGWPCYEGIGQSGPYQSAVPAHDGCNTLPNPNPAFSPLATWHHDDPNLSVPPGFIGNASIGGTFYTGTSYPSAFQGRYFFGDYGQSFIKVAVVDANNQLLQIVDFASNAAGPVDFATNPTNGDIYYVAIGTNQVLRIRFTGSQGGNSPPTAHAAANPDVGTPPMLVTFSSAGTFDIDNDPLIYSWAFGDGQGSTSQNPQHTYTQPGIYNAVLTVDDGRSGVDRDTVVVVCAESGNFPTTPVLDSFNRANGPVGPNWVDPAYGLAGVDIVNNQLHHACCYQAPVWSPTSYGPDQEAYITITQLATNELGHDLMLKVQGNSWDNAHVEVRYDDTQHHVGVATYTPGPGWQDRGNFIPVTFVSGDQLGARAYSNGTLEVYKNGLLIGQVSLGTWPFAGAGGRIGLTLDGTTGARFDNFGGGNTVIDSNTPPEATILTPVNGSFYAAGDQVQLSGTATDAQDPIGELDFRWEMDIHHNNHVHPNSVVLTGPTGSYTADNHDDGTGVFDEIRLIVTDTGGKRDTARVFIYPEIDLEPSVVTTVPSTPGTTAPAEYWFRIYNHGRMPAPNSRWRLTANTTLLAEGDVIVPALDSVTIVQMLPPTLAAGTYTLRVKVDSLAAVFETNEANNAVARPLTVVTGPGPDEVPPVFTTGPVSLPHQNDADIVWETGEPTTGVVRYGRSMVFSDSVATALATQHDVLLTNLYPGTRYYYVVVAMDTVPNTTVAPVDSFLTTGAVAVGDPPPIFFGLSSPFPNPSSGTASVMLSLPRPSRVSLTVHDIQGREVWSDPMRELPAGRWKLDWPGRREGGARVPTGVYLARVTVDGKAYIRRVAILR